MNTRGDLDWPPGRLRRACRHRWPQGASRYQVCVRSMRLQHVVSASHPLQRMSPVPLRQPYAVVDGMGRDPPHPAPSSLAPFSGLEDVSSFDDRVIAHGAVRRVGAVSPPGVVRFGSVGDGHHRRVAARRRQRASSAEVLLLLCSRATFRTPLLVSVAVCLRHCEGCASHIAHIGETLYVDIFTTTCRATGGDLSPADPGREVPCARSLCQSPGQYPLTP
jgi:hypothetical protein